MVGVNKTTIISACPVHRSIDKHTGDIKVNSTLSYQMASVIVLTVRAVDTNAADNVKEQYDEAEVTVFVKPYKNQNPVFTTNAGWSGADDSAAPLVIAVDEETPIGTELVQLGAVDVLTNRSLYGFEAVTALPRQIAMDYTGKVILTERLDYETLRDKVRTGSACQRLFTLPSHLIFGRERRIFYSSR